jgi:hypothetical protein
MEWKKDYTNLRNWEIIRELQYSHSMSVEEINNLPLECWVFAGIVQKIIRQHSTEWREEQKGIHKVKPCEDSEFNEIKCLESEYQYGFFKSEADIRPSSCTWINKEDAEKLYSLFRKKGD